MRKILLSILLSGIWFLSTAQTTSTLPSGYTPFATQLYYKIASGDTTIVTGATGKGFHVIPTTQSLRDSLAKYVPLTRTLTINGSTQSLSANRTWNVGTVTSITPGYGLTPQTAITSTGAFGIDTLVLDTVYAKISDPANITIGSLSNTPTANGMSYTSDILRLHRMSASTPGSFRVGVDTIPAGTKYLHNDIWTLDDQISDGHTGLSSASNSLHAPLFGASSESATFLAQMLAHPASNRYNMNPADGIIFQIYINEGPDPTTSGRAYSFKNGSTHLLDIAHDGDMTAEGALNLLDNKSDGGVISIGSGNPSLMAPGFGVNSETTDYWLKFIGQPSSIINGSNPLNAFNFSAFRSTDDSQAMTSGNLVNFFNKDVSKLSVDYNGVITSAGLTNGLVKSTSGVLSNATVASDYTLLNGTGIVEMAGTTASYLSSTGTGNVVKATSPTLTTPNIGASTFSTLTGGTASTITFANTSAGGIQDAISIRNGGTTAGTGNRINFITGTSTQSARINSVLTSSTVADLVFSTMTGGTLAESGRFLGDKTLQLAAGLNLSGQMTSTMGNNTTLFSSSSATTGYQFFNMQNTSGRLLWGIDGSAGGTFITGGSAYSGAMTTIGARNLEFGTDQALGLKIDGSNRKITLPELGGAGDVIVGADNNGLLGEITVGSGLSLSAGVLTATGGSSGSVTTAGGTAGRIAKFTSASNVENSIITESSGLISIAGNIESTSGNNQIVFDSKSATTGYQYQHLKNTSGETIFGIEGSSSGTLLTNGSAYAGVLSTVGSQNLELGTNQTKRLTIAHTTGDITATGNISAANLSGTNTGDQTTITGNAGTATALQTARNIQGVSFNGTADINPINGTGFVKATGTTLSYDNTTYAPLNSPALTGTPTAPTPTQGDNSTKIATTAYVDAAVSTIDAGVLSPTLTNTLNLSSATVYIPMIWQRIDNTVSYSMSISVVPTGSGNCEIGIALPVASNFSTGIQAVGTGNAIDMDEINLLLIQSDSTNDRLRLNFNSPLGANATINITGSYIIVP